MQIVSRSQRFPGAPYVFWAGCKWNVHSVALRHAIVNKMSLNLNLNLGCIQSNSTQPSFYKSHNWLLVFELMPTNHFYLYKMMMDKKFTHNEYVYIQGFMHNMYWNIDVRSIPRSQHMWFLTLTAKHRDAARIWYHEAAPARIKQTCFSAYILFLIFGVMHSFYDIFTNTVLSWLIQHRALLSLYAALPAVFLSACN